jgi:GNAT superfamily N-acetyltransferase
VSRLRVVHTLSPLAYYKGPPVRRFQVVDDAAPPPRPTDVYFAETRRTVRYGKTGRALKKPHVETTPGADPGVLGFIDWTPAVPYTRACGVFIHYTSVRQDMRKQGVFKRMLEAFLAERGGKDCEVDFGQIHHNAVAIAYQRLRAEGYTVRGKL